MFELRAVTCIPYIYHHEQLKTAFPYLIRLSNIFQELMRIYKVHTYFCLQPQSSKNRNMCKKSHYKKLINI